MRLTELADRYDVIGVEDIDMRGMSRSLNFGKSVMDNGWGMFRTFLEYKMRERGKYLVKIDRFFPSSKRCHECGHVKSDLALSDREWVCPVCGTKHERDRNAALNIRDEAKRMLLSGDFPAGGQSGSTVGHTGNALEGADEAPTRQKPPPPCAKAHRRWEYVTLSADVNKMIKGALEDVQSSAKDFSAEKHWIGVANVGGVGKLPVPYGFVSLSGQCGTKEQFDKKVATAKETAEKAAKYLTAKTGKEWRVSGMEIYDSEDNLLAEEADWKDKHDVTFLLSGDQMKVMLES